MATFPLTVIPSSWEWTVLSNDEFFTDAAGGIWTRGRVGNRLQFTLLYQNLVGATRRALWAEVMRLNGRRNRLSVDMGLIGYSRAGAGGGTPVLSATVDAGATQLPISGGPLSTTGFLLQSDWIAVNGELKMVTADVDTDGAGAATINVWPEVHKDAASATPVQTEPASISGTFVLQDAQGMGAVPNGPDADSGSTWLNQSPGLVLEEDVYA